MRITYIAKHNSGGNDDEGAIAHALRQLGHQVALVHERTPELAFKYDPELILFHKGTSSLVLKNSKCLKAFWYFDLVDWADPKLATRCSIRRQWMTRALPMVSVGFCTDGDWAAKSVKLVHLTQGADGRCVAQPRHSAHKILFTGITRGGAGREDFVAEMRRVYGDTFHQVQSGAYRQQLCTLVAGADIVVAPDSPVTDRYWSNRVYVTLNAGGFLLHPWSAGLAEQYAHGEELVFYHSREELHALIAQYSRAPEERARIAMGGLARTRKEHLYIHRCQKLLEIVCRRR